MSPASGSARAGSTGTRPNPASRALVAVLVWYRDAVSPALPPRCRFYPTCSTYAVTAVRRYGAGRGSWLTLGRILRCGPWHPGGVDHVPSIGSEGDPPEHLRHPSVSPKDVGPQRRSVSQERAVV